MQKTFKPYEYVLFALVTVAGSWIALHFVSNGLSEKYTYNSNPAEVQLKAEPKDIIYSEAFRNEKGNVEIKYAYTSEEVTTEEGEDISRRTPSSQTYVLEQFEDEEGKPMEKLKTVFIPKPQFYNEGDSWKQIQYATTTQEIFSQSGAIKHIKQREFAERVLNTLFGIEPVFAVTSTFYPDPDAETSSVDGQIGTTASDVDSYTAWSTARTSTTGTVSDAVATISIATDQTYTVRTALYRSVVRRGFLLFDTSTLGAGATVSSATLSVWPTSKVNTDNSGSDTIGIYTSAPASNTALATGDFDSITYTAQATAVDITGLSTGAYYNFTLNATGLSNISKTGVTKFSVIGGHDVADLNHLTDTENSVTISSAEEASTTQDPKLEVTYTAGVNFSFGQWLPF